MLAACASFHAAPLPGAPKDAAFVDVGGVHVHYREAGSGPTVVLIHGYGASADAWAAVQPYVAAHHRVIAVDLAGFGWSSRPEDADYSPAGEARLVWGVLDRLGVADVAIVGHSWGSSVALAMAVQHPERTRRVALYDAYVYDEQVPSFFRWAELDGLGEALFALFYTERIEDRAPLAYYDERWVTEERVERVERDLDRPGTTAAALAVAREHHFGELHAQLRGFTKPVLLLWGENDQVTPVSYGQRLVNELSNAQLKTYPRCGHIPMVEAHVQSTRDLVEFLDETAPATPVVIAPLADVRGSRPAALLPPAADISTLGAELTPRAYAAPREHVEVDLHGYLRTRAADYYNLDLDRGLDSRGLPLFPIPLDGGQSLDSADIRARTDVAIYARGVGVAVKARIDWLDNTPLGGDPDLAGGSPATSGGQRPSEAVVKRAWAEALTPAGTLAVGRMGAHFGLGIAANGGDCEDCDHGDAADRLAFVSPIAGHLVAVAYDIASRGPFTPSADGGHAIALEPTDRAAGPTLAILKVHSPAALARRAAAGLTNLEYAAYISRRTQENDVPAWYLPSATPTTSFTSADLVARGFEATATGAWLRVTNSILRIEAELAYINASVAQPSLVPGAVITEPVTSSQLGFAFESDLAIGPVRTGLDGGYASGDPAPGFGAFPTAGEQPAPPGALDGPQANPPGDRTVDNFRFHPDYHIDQILFREIIGTITDAVYARPHVRTTVMTVGTGTLDLGAALIASWAVDATSTPSGTRPLGIELDPELRYASRDGFAATVDYGVLFPGTAFDNPTAHLEAHTAQIIRARLVFVF
ncbi:MAG TPA: TIGR04551 family protein [Kofleriaceae bacterium]|nr:TIGR04551 family protein [Kofleriaceae bacterium]